MSVWIIFALNKQGRKDERAKCQLFYVCVYNKKESLQMSATCFCVSLLQNISQQKKIECDKKLIHIVI